MRSYEEEPALKAFRRVKLFSVERGVRLVVLTPSSYKIFVFIDDIGTCCFALRTVE